MRGTDKFVHGCPADCAGCSSPRSRIVGCNRRAMDLAHYGMTPPGPRLPCLRPDLAAIADFDAERVNDND